MTWFYEFLHWLCGKMEEPHMLGWFHLMMVGIVIALTIVYIVLWRKADEKTYRKISQRELQQWCVRNANLFTVEEFCLEREKR